MSLSESDTSRPPTATGKKTRRGSRGTRKSKKNSTCPSPSVESVKETITDNGPVDFVQEWVFQSGHGCPESSQHRFSAHDLQQVVEEMETESDEAVFATDSSSLGESSSLSLSQEHSASSSISNERCIIASELQPHISTEEVFDWAEEMMEEDSLEEYSENPHQERKDTPIPDDDTVHPIESTQLPSSCPQHQQITNQKPRCTAPEQKIFSYANAASKLSESDRMKIINTKLVQIRHEEERREQEERRKNTRTVVTTTSGRISSQSGRKSSQKFFQ